MAIGSSGIVDMGLKVLHIIPSVADCRGGPSKAVIEMVAALNQHGVVAEIATTNDAGPELLQVELGNLIDYKGVPCRFFARWSPPVSALQEFQYSRPFTRWLKAHITDYDVIHIHAIFSFCSSYAMWLARKTGIPYVVRSIGQLEQWSLQQSAGRKRLYMALLERRNLLSAQYLHCTAESEATQALQYLPELKPLVIPLGIGLPSLDAGSKAAVRKQYQIDDGQVVLLYLSRLHPKKGLELLLQALATTANQSFHLLIGGDGDPDYRQRLIELVEQLGLNAKVSWLGFVSGPQKVQLLQGADLFTLTSYSENFGISVLEALASATPVLISQGVALSDQVARHQIGYISTTAIESITTTLDDALQQISNNPQDHQTMAERARSVVDEHYAWHNIAARLSTAYQQCVTR